MARVPVSTLLGRPSAQRDLAHQAASVPLKALKDLLRRSGGSPLPLAGGLWPP